MAPISELLTKKQQAALVLDRAGFSQREIAKRLRLKHKQSAQQLIYRARARQAAIERASLEMLARV